MVDDDSDLAVNEIVELYRHTKQAIEDTLNSVSEPASSAMLIAHSAIVHSHGVYTVESVTDADTWSNIGKAIIKKLVELLIKLAVILDSLLKKVFSRVAFAERKLLALNKQVIDDIKVSAQYTPSVVRITQEMTGVLGYTGKTPEVKSYADVIVAITAEANLTGLKSFSTLINEMAKITMTTATRLPSTVRADVLSYEKRAMLEVEAMVIAKDDIMGMGDIKTYYIKSPIGPINAVVKFDNRPTVTERVWSRKMDGKQENFPKSTVRSLTAIECKRILAETVGLLRSHRELSGFFTLTSDLTATLKGTSNFLEEVSSNEAMGAEARVLAAELSSALGTWEALYRNVNHAKISNTLAIANSVAWWVGESMKGVKYEQQ